MQITRKCASIGRRGKFENSIVFGLVNNFRRVFGQSTVHLMCRCVVQTSGVREWTVFLLQHASQLLYVVRGRLLQLEKGKNPGGMNITFIDTKPKPKFIFILVVGVCIIEIYLVRPNLLKFFSFFSFFSVPASFNLD
jgi:hypothetical protein